MEIIKRKDDYISQIQNALLDKFTPAAIGIDKLFQIVYSNGPIQNFFTYQRGPVSKSLFDFLPRWFHSRLRTAITKAFENNEFISIRINLPNELSKKRIVDLTFMPVPSTPDVVLITFEEKKKIKKHEIQVVTSPCHSLDDQHSIENLENELSTTREDLQKHIEQLELLNEEVESYNEELQATNEELETSKEELQSLNEELVSVNSQLQKKIDEQETINNDLNNFISSTNIPTLFLDNKLRIRRFTPALTKLMGLISTDIGRYLIDLSYVNLGPKLLDEIKFVVNNMNSCKCDFELNSNWYSRTILPYRTSNNKIDGVIVTFIDITDLKRIEKEIRDISRIPGESPAPILRIDLSGTILYINNSGREYLKTIDCNVGSKIPDLWFKETKLASESNTKRVLISECDNKIFQLTFNPILEFSYVNIYFADVTARFEAKRALERERDLLSTIIDSPRNFYLAYLDINYQFVRVNKIYADSFNLKPQDLAGKNFFDFYKDERIKEVFSFIEHTGNEFEFHDQPFISSQSNSITTFWDGVITPVKSDGKILGFLLTCTDTTKRKVAEDALRASEEKFRQVYQNALIGIIISDWEGQFLHANPFYCNMLGYTEEELKQINFASLVHPDDRYENMVKNLALKSGEIPHFEIQNRYIHKDRYEIWVHKNVSILYSETGEPSHFLVLVTDITEKRNSEISLRNSEERFRKMFEDSNAMMILTSPENGDFIDVNLSAATFYGYSREQMRTMNASHTHVLSKNEIEIMRKKISDNEDKIFIVPQKLADGEVRTVEVYPTRITIDNKPAIFSIVHDITDRLRIEDSLKESQSIVNQRFQEIEEIYRTTPVGLCVLDTELRYVRINNQLAQVNGKSAKDHIGKKFNELAPHIAQITDPYFKEVFITKEPKLNIEFQFSRNFQKQSTRFSLLHLSPLKNTKDEVIGINVVLEDITARKRYEKLIEESAKRFEILSFVSSELLNVSDPQNVIDSLCHKVMEHLDCHVFFNFLLDKSVNKLHLNAAGGVSLEKKKELEWLDLGVAICGTVAQKGERIVACHIQDGSDPLAEVVRNFGIKAYACHPLLTKDGEIIGTLSFGTRNCEEFNDNDLELMKAVSGHVSIALERIQYQDKLKQLFVKIREQQWLFENVTNQVPAAIALHEGPHFVTTIANPSFVKLSRPNGEIIGRTVAETWPQAEDIILPILKRVYSLGQPYVLVDQEVPNVNGNNNDYEYFTFSYLPFLNVHGEIQGVLVLAINTTESVRARKKIEQTALRDEAILTSMMDGLIISSPNGELLYANPAARTFYDLEPQNNFSGFYTNCSVYDLKGILLPQELWPISRALRREKYTNLELMIVNKHTGRIWYGNFNGTPVFDKNENLMSAIMSIRNVTESVYARQQLAYMAARYKEIFENVSDALVVVDGNGEIREMNSAAMRLYDENQEQPSMDVVSLHEKFELYNANTNETISKHNCPYMQVFQGVNITNYEIRAIHKESKKEWFGSFTVIPVYDKGIDLPSYVIASIQNITENKKTLKRLQESEQNVLQRAKELSFANKELETFSYSVSHDLRAPIRAMIGFSDFLLEDYATKLDEEAKHLLKRIRNSGFKMKELIDDMLKLSIITRQEMVLKKVDISYLAQSILDELRLSDNERKVHTTVQENMNIIGDENLIKIALSNLIRNAWKYTGKVQSARIEIGNRQENGNTIFFIRDNGAGFDMRKAKKLFSPFVRLHPESDFPGTGIGLATVERVISRHGGKIWVEAEVLKGATFYFTIDTNSSK